jgi:hypothetical protein
MLADTYALLPFYGKDPNEEAHAKGLAEAERALSLDSTEAMTYAALG